VIFVDTSVWVAAFRAAAGREAAKLRSLLDRDAVALAIPVRIELLTGASVADRGRLRRVLSALPIFLPTDLTWQTIDGWLDVAGKAGEKFGFADLLIGAIAAEHRAPLWSLDADFTRMARLRLIELHAA
jgi:predicted nucleic acid-binding protein